MLIAPKRSGVRRLVDDVAFARRLRRERFDIAIDFHGGPRSSWLVWRSGAPVRIGYRTSGRTWMYTHAVPRPPDLSPEHSVLKQWRLLAPLGIGACDSARDAMYMPDDRDAAARAGRTLADAGIQPHHALIVIHVSAGNPFRRWPREHFATLVTELARRDPNRRVLLTSGPSDRDAARDIVARVGRRGVAAAAVAHGQFDVQELRVLASRAAVYIGGDSGPLHIAATTQSPVVALFGPTLAERSMPWRDRRWFAEALDAGPLPCRPCRQRRCEPGDFRCLTGIDPERVAAAAERGLAAHAARSEDIGSGRARHA